MADPQCEVEFTLPLLNSADLPDVVIDIDKSYYQHLDELREQYPAVRLLRRGKEVVMFLRTEEARTLLQDFERFTSERGDDEPYIEDNLIPSSMDPPEHGKWRGLISGWFTPRAVRGMEAGMRTLATTLIDQIIDQGSCDFIPSFGKPYPGLIFCQLMDFPIEDMPHLVKHEAMVWTPPGEDPDRILNRQGLAVLREYLYDQIKLRRAAPRSGLFDYLLTMEVDGRKATDYEIVMMSLLLCLGGFHTTKGALSRMIIHLARHPEERRALRDAPVLIPKFIEEILRIYTLGETFRRVREDTVLAGVRLKKGTVVSAHKPAANRDPRMFDNPQAIDLARPGPRHIAFGAGPHMCLGMHVARTDIRIALEEWHKRIPDYEIQKKFVVTEQLFSGVGPREIPLVWQ